MKRIISFIVAIIALSISSLYAQETVNKTFDFGDFNGIKAAFVHKVYITQGTSNKIEVSCPKRFEEFMDYSVSGGILNLNMDFNNKKYGSTNDEWIIVKVQMEEIKSISLSGLAELVATGEYYTDNFNLYMSGASEITKTLNVYANNFIYDLSGASKCKINGGFAKIEGETSGAVELDLVGNAAVSVTLEASGASEVSYKGNTHSLNIECSGASEVELEGSTVFIGISCSGAADVDAQHMTAEDAKASASGASQIKVFGNNKLELKTSGVSKIKYYGKAQQLQLTMPENSISRGK